MSIYKKNLDYIAVIIKYIGFSLIFNIKRQSRYFLHNFVIQNSFQAAFNKIIQAHCSPVTTFMPQMRGVAAFAFIGIRVCEGQENNSNPLGAARRGFQGCGEGIASAWGPEGPRALELKTLKSQKRSLRKCCVPVFRKVVCTTMNNRRTLG